MAGNAQNKNPDNIIATGSVDTLAMAKVAGCPPDP
jgi:hypothetical protein